MLRAPESALLMEEGFCDEVTSQFGSVRHARRKSFHAVGRRDFSVSNLVMESTSYGATSDAGESHANHDCFGRQSHQDCAGIYRFDEKSALMREALKALIDREAAWRLAEMGGTAPDMAYVPRRRAKAK